MVAREGGDEIDILIEEENVIHDTEIKVAQRIIEDLQEPVLVEGRELFTSVSIGIAISAPEYRMAEEMLRDADIAMYRAKSSDTQRFEIFNESLHLEAIRALEIEGDLHRAIARQEFEPYFQQIVRLDTGAVVGFESLLRWNHPERGVLTPDAFLAIAEASGSLEAIDWQMFDLTCAAVSRLVRPGQYVNLNFSPRHFRDKHMDQRLLSLLREHGVSPSQVRIEVTEGTLIDNADQVAEIIDRLYQAGVLTSLDDFGTGYSSLGYLHRFHLHAVKIDRSFVTPLKPGGGGASEAVVRAIMALAKSQGLDVIAEGVETVIQRDALLALGCLTGQGWLYSKPMPLSAMQSVW
jgi:EAL domain-containing protein (putative c-di-GMP-specific phosphodiesterase class I)